MKDTADQATVWPVEVHEAHGMGGFGERMQREREMRSIALEEIAESTKISCRMLRALEEEDFDKLPGGIFNKGFVRAYAKFLGIDEEQAVVDYQAAFVEKQQKLPTNGANGMHHGDVLSTLAAAAEDKPQSQPDQAAGFMRAAVILICLLGIGGLAWKFLWNKPATSALPEQTQNVNRANATVAPSNPASSTANPAPAQDASPAQAKPPEQSPSTPTPENVAADGAFRLQITLKERSWVQVTGDGKVLMESDLPASTTRSFRAAKEMVVKLGNAPGVELSYNGKPLPQFPPDQKTRTLTFTPNGLQPQ